MDLKKIHDRVFFLANREQNYWTPEEIDDNLHIAQLWKLNQTIPEYAKSQKAQDDLSPFKKKFPFSDSTTTGGVIQFDTEEYFQFLGLYVQFFNALTGRIDYEQVKILSEDEIAYRLKSQLTPVTKETPVAMVEGLGKYQLYPEVPNSGYAHFLKIPEAPKYTYTLEGRQKVYNKNNSEQLLWNEGAINEIIVKTLQLLGVNIEPAALLQFAQTKAQENI